MKNKPWNLKPILGLTAMVITGILFVQCDLPGSSSGSGSSVSTSPLADLPHTFLYSASYQVAGNSLVRTQVDTVYMCNGTTLTSSTDSYTDTMPYLLQGSVLSFPNFDSIFDTTERFTAYVRHDRNYNRVGSGSGLQGLWQASGYSYKVLSGTLPSDMKTAMDMELTLYAQFLNYYDRDQIQVTSNSLLYYHDVKSAQGFMDDWNGNLFGKSSEPHKAAFNIDASTVDQYTVKLKGKTTAETMNYTHYGDYTEIYTSSNAAHHTITYGHHYVPNCSSSSPTDSDWTYSFYDDNAIAGDSAAGVMAKVEARRSVATPRGKSFRDPWHRYP